MYENIYNNSIYSLIKSNPPEIKHITICIINTINNILKYSVVLVVTNI